MKKISINKNHLLTFSQLSAEKVKAIIVGLLAGDIEGIKNPEAKGIAKLIANENLSQSERKRLAQLKDSSQIEKQPTKSKLSTQKQEKLSTQPELSTHQNDQIDQNNQNDISSPFISPCNQGMIKNLNINNISCKSRTECAQQTTKNAQFSQKSNQQCGKQNCFNSHLNECSRVPIRTKEERETILKPWFTIVDEISGFVSKTKNDDWCQHQKDLRTNALLEIVDTFLEMIDCLNLTGCVMCGKIKLNNEIVAKMVLYCDYDVLKNLIWQLAYSPEKIKNHPYYILRAVFKNLTNKGVNLI